MRAIAHFADIRPTLFFIDAAALNMSGEMQSTRTAIFQERSSP
jgi:hypothetical protein